MPTTSFVISGILNALFFLQHYLTVAAATSSDIHVPNATLSNLVLGSCHNDRKVQSNQPNIWSAIQQENPDLFVWSGDSVYPKQRKLANLTYMEQLYNNMLQNDTIGYNQLQPKFGIWGTWDDHDFGANDAGIETPDKMERASLFYNFLNLPSRLQSSSDSTSLEVLSKRKGLYYSVTFGDDADKTVKLILLDTRWHRSKHCFPSLATKVPSGAGFAAATRWALAGFNINKWWPFWDCWNSSVLGEEQWKWLETELQPENQGSINIVVSSIQVLTTNPTVEGWGHFPQERQRLLKLLGGGISGLLVVSGDVHHAEILNPLSSLGDNKKHSFLEVTSSGMTHYCSQPLYGPLCEPLLNYYNHNRHATNTNYYIGKNYGRINIDWHNQQLEMLIQNDVGETQLRTGMRAFQQDSLTQQEVDSIAFCVDGHMIKPFFQILVALGAVLMVVILQHQQRSNKPRPVSS